MNDSKNTHTHIYYMLYIIYIILYYIHISIDTRCTRADGLNLGVMQKSFTIVGKTSCLNRTALTTSPGCFPLCLGSPWFFWGEAGVGVCLAKDKHLARKYDLESFVAGRTECKAALQKKLGLVIAPDAATRCMFFLLMLLMLLLLLLLFLLWQSDAKSRPKFLSRENITSCNSPFFKGLCVCHGSTPGTS